MHIATEPPERGSYNFLLFCFELDRLYGEEIHTGFEAKKTQVIPWPAEWPIPGGPFAVHGPKAPGDFAACVFVSSRYTRDELLSRGPHWFDKTADWFALLDARAGADGAAAEAAAKAKAEEEAAAAKALADQESAAAAKAKADEEAAAALAAAAVAAQLAAEQEAELARMIAEEEAATAAAAANIQALDSLLDEAAAVTTPAPEAPAEPAPEAAAAGGE